MHVNNLTTWGIQSHSDGYMYVNNIPSHFDICSVDGLKIVTVTMEQDSTHTLQICSLPSLEPVYRLQLSASSWLVRCPSSQV